MKQLIIFLFTLINIAYGQSTPTTAKTRFVNGLYIGTKANSYFNFADSNAIYWAPDSLLMAKYKGLAKSLAFSNDTRSGYVRLTGRDTINGAKTFIDTFRAISQFNYFGKNNEDGYLYIRGFNNSTARFIAQTGVSTVYNGLLISSNPNNDNSLPRWDLDLGGNDQVLSGNTNGLDIRTRQFFGGSFSSVFRVNNIGDVTTSKIGLGTNLLSGYNMRIFKSLSGNPFSISVSNEPVVQSDVTTEANNYFSSLSTQAAPFTLPIFSHFRATQNTIGAGSAVNIQYGFTADNTLTAGSILNAGFVGNLQEGTGRFNLYMLSNANNLINGRLGIGVTPTSDISLRVRRPLENSSGPVAILADGVIQPAATSIAAYYLTTSNTAASAFTLPTLNHFRAVQGTIGIGSSVTNQIAFEASSNLTAGTNLNIGFRGRLNLSPDSWNNYNDGTANNYFRGRALFNTLVDDGVNQVQVVGNTITSQIITGSFNPNAILRNTNTTLSSLYTTLISDNGSNYTYTLDAATGHNRIYVIRVIGAGVITLNRSGSDVIYDNAGVSQTTINITAASGAVWFQSNGSNYYIQLK